MSTTDNRRILIIDDNPAIHEDFHKILQPGTTDDEFAALEAEFFGEENAPPAVTFELVDAYQGEEARDLVESACQEGNPFALAFVDMRMPPGWDGLETIKKLWEVDENLQIVICSAYSDRLWEDVCRDLGRGDNLLILKKPFDNVEVRQLAQTLTEKRKLSQRWRAQIERLDELVLERTKELQEARDASERLLNAISSLVISLDTEGKIVRWNTTAAEVFNRTEEEVRGKTIVDIGVNWIDPQAVQDAIYGDADEQKRIEIQFLDEKEATRIIGLSVYPVPRGEDRFEKLCLGTDLTRQRTMQTQLQHAQKLESVGQLAAGVAHEINTPMQYLGDNIEYLQTKFEKLTPLLENYPTLLDLASRSSEQHDLIDELRAKLTKLKLKSFMSQVADAINDSREGVQHVARIVRAMKEFSHPGQEERTPIDINRALDSTIAVSTNEWKYVADVETQYQENLTMVCGMPGEINQVFLNIIVNAAHAIGDTNNGGADGKGKITISTSADDQYVVVSIRDTGTGIPDEIKNRIFDPFFTTKEVRKGTGQGLAITHSVIVQKHSGQLEVNSTVGEGTEFVIRLPIEPIAPHQEDNDDVADSRETSESETVSIEHH